MSRHGDITLELVEQAVPPDREITARRVWKRLGGREGAFSPHYVRKCLNLLTKANRVVRSSAGTNEIPLSLYRRSG